MLDYMHEFKYMHIFKYIRAYQYISIMSIDLDLYIYICIYLLNSSPQLLRLNF